MRCPEQGQLRAYSDRELPGAQHQMIEEHVTSCRACQLRLDELETNAALVKNVLDQALMVSKEVVPEPKRALVRCQQDLLTNDTLWSRIRKGGPIMKGSFQNTGVRLGTLAAMLCVCVIVALAFEPVRSAAEDLLGVFRAERFTAVTVDVNNLPDIPDPSDLGTFTQPETPKISRLTPAEVQSLSSIKILEPTYTAGLRADDTYQVSESMQASFTIDAEKVKKYLASQGISGLLVPDNIDGATIKVNVSPIVLREYRHPTDERNQHISIVQTTSPTLEVPDNLDLELLRSRVLDSALLPTDLSSQLSAIQDWKNTAVIPVPSDATRLDVDIAGVPGLLISGPKYGAGAFWQKDGIYYGVTGNMSQEETLKIARSIK